ncbi:hypothetical protein F4779DRAFT_578201 [Xylariaceae sp. FL0662B]|nr:hypothetical protein F4779DRAFT_578201 [Xylariaceae sp. FL0662B]
MRLSIICTTLFNAVLFHAAEAMTPAEAQCILCMANHSTASAYLDQTSTQIKVTLGLDWCVSQGACGTKTNWYYVTYGGEYASPTIVDQANRVMGG